MRFIVDHFDSVCTLGALFRQYVVNKVNKEWITNLKDETPTHHVDYCMYGSSEY